MAFQIGFDLYESATQNFLSRVQASLKTVGTPSTDSTPAPATTPAEGEKKEG